MALRRGDDFPSVTEVLELNNLVDLSMIPSSVLEAARKRGELVHKWTEWIDRGEIDGCRGPNGEPWPEDIGPYLNAWEGFKRHNKVEITAIEEYVKNDLYRYDGTLDRLAIIDGGRALLDIKCVYALHHTTALQTAGYAACYPDGPEPLDRYAVQLKRDGTYALQQYKDRQDLPRFLAAVSVAHYKLQHKESLPWLVP